MVQRSHVASSSHNGVSAFARRNSSLLLPTELWVLIIKDIRGFGNFTKAAKKRLTALSLVCRLFGELTRPILFASLVICNEPSNPHFQPNVAGFCRELQRTTGKATYAAQFVREVRFIQWQYTPEDWAAKKFYDMYLRSLPRLGLLAHIHLEEVFLNLTLFQILGQLGDLQTLVFKACMAVVEDFTQISKISCPFPPNLTQLHVMSIIRHITAHPARLPQLRPNATNDFFLPALSRLPLISLTIQDSNLSRALLGYRGFQSLHALTICLPRDFEDAADAPKLSEFLGSLTNLKSLCLDSAKRIPPLKPVVGIVPPKGSLQQLTSLECPASYVAGLMERVNIETLGVVIPSPHYREKEAVMEGSHLKFMVSQLGYRVYAALLELSLGPTPWLGSLNDQRTLVTALGNTVFPNLQRFQSSKNLVWRLQQRQWTPFWNDTAAEASVIQKEIDGDVFEISLGVSRSF